MESNTVKELRNLISDIKIAENIINHSKMGIIVKYSFQELLQSAKTNQKDFQRLQKELIDYFTPNDFEKLQEELIEYF